MVALTMLLLGLDAALPLLLLGMLSREVLVRWSDRMMGLGKGLKVALGAILVATGLMIATGYGKAAETVLVNASPAWLTNLTTRHAAVVLGLLIRQERFSGGSLPGAFRSGPILNILKTCQGPVEDVGQS